MCARLWGAERSLLASCTGSRNVAALTLLVAVALLLLFSIYTNQSGWTIPDHSLRGAVKRVIKDDLLGTYQDFLRRWVRSRGEGGGGYQRRGGGGILVP
jgi:hypothetical protein